MKVKINQSIANGKIQAQPSKSYAHRLLLASALAKGTSVIRNIILSDDIKCTIDAIKNLNKKVIIQGKKRKRIIMMNNHDKIDPDELITVNCFESGSTLRFLIPILLTRYTNIEFVCSKRLIERGVNEYIDIFKDQDIEIKIEENKIKVNGHLHAGKFTVDGSKSSQYLTGLLFALPLLKEKSIINIKNLKSRNYILMTLDVLSKAGVIILQEENSQLIVPGNQKYNHLRMRVEGDYSNSSFIDALNYLGGIVKVKGLNKNSLQGDKVYKKYFRILSRGNYTIDLSNCIDLGPILFCFAALNKGGTFTNTNRLRLKESNRIACLKEELAKFNVEVIEEENKVIINNENITGPTEVLSSHNDHRITMALAIMLTKFGGILDDMEAVNKSYPDFFEDLKSVKVKLELINQGCDE